MPIRDGARLHAGTFPSGGTLDLLLAKTAFLADCGTPSADAQAALMAAIQLILGNALEAQAAEGQSPPGLESINHLQGFEAGLRLLVAGLAQQQVHAS